MANVLPSLIAAGAVLVVWYAVVAAYALATRPRDLPAGPPVSGFGPEPPAVVNLLVTRCRMTAAAADATLLDLAARRVVELHQPGPDPAELLVRVRGPEPAGLAPYERRVLDRVRSVAGDRFTPLREISGRYADGGPRWLRHLRAEVVADARARGLVRARRAGVPVLLATVLVAMMVGCLAVLPWQRNDSGVTDVALVVAAGVGTVAIALVMIIILYAHLRAPGHTAAGRAVGSRWLGFGRWLAGYESLADLPPAAVAVWDRYLAYGVALGVNPVAGRALDLRAGHTVTLLSRATGTPRPVVVRYPRDPLAYTQAGVRLAWSFLVLAAWAVFWVAAAPRIGHWPPFLRWHLYALGVLAPARAAYKVIRASVDKLAPVTVTGTVLAVHPYRTGSGAMVTFHQVVLDDGRADRTRPWLVRGDRLAGTAEGEVVRVRAQRWTRYVLALDRR